MTRNIIQKYKLYVEGKTEKIFFYHILNITNNKDKYTIYLLAGGGHLSQFEKICKDYNSNKKIWIVDNVCKYENDKSTLKEKIEKEQIKIEIENTKYVISDKQFEDSIIDFLNIPNTENNSKKSVDKYLKDNNIFFEDFLIDKIKDKNYIKDNLENIKNEDMKFLLKEILNSYKEDNLV